METRGDKGNSGRSSAVLWGIEAGQSRTVSWSSSGAAAQRVLMIASANRMAQQRCSA